MKVAIVHDYFFQNGGAEKTVEVMMNKFPGADIYTTLYYPKAFKDCHWLTKAYEEGRVKTSFLQWFLANPIGIKFFKHFFWLYPLAAYSMRVKGYDAVMISHTYPSKNTRFKDNKHIVSYCHSPSRFLHNMTRETDMQAINPVLRFFVPFFFWLKWQDIRAAKKLESIGAHWYVNATHMKGVVKKAYDIDCKVLFPPTDTDHFRQLPKKVNTKEPYYFYFGRISFHKKINILIDACAMLGKRFYICGGSGLQVEVDKLQEQIDELDTKYPGTKDRIKLVGRLPDKQRDEYIQGAKGFIFAGKEDFGIAPIEALASGTPIIMYQAGGALDYLKDGVNGVFSPKQTPESFAKAIEKFETLKLKEKDIRDSSDEFNTENFYKELKRVIHGE